MLYLRQITLGAILALIVSNILTFTIMRNTQGRLAKEQASHAQTIENFKTAQREADIRAQAIRETLLKEAEADAKQADANYSALLSKYNASLLRYKANQSAAVRPDSSQYPATQSGDGPSASPEVPPAGVVISMSDAQICAVNTARLQAVREWAISLPK